MNRRTLFAYCEIAQTRVGCFATSRNSGSYRVKHYYYYYYYYYYHHHHHHHLLYEGIYTYIPETNYVPREHSVAAILFLLFMVLISLVSVLNLLYFHISTFRSMCAALNMAVFCSSLTSWFPGMLLTYFPNDFEIVPVAPIITGITFIFYIPHALYFYCKVFIF